MKQQQPIARQGKHPKRGFAMIDTAKEINVWVYRVKDDLTYVVCDSPNFEPSATYYDAKRSDLKDLYQKRQSSISSKPKALTAAEKVHKSSLNVFFASQMLTMPFICDNCSLPLKAFSNYKKRCCIGHIIPKSLFPTVATHPQNRLFLGSSFGGASCTCHDDYDGKGAEYRTGMNCYNLAIERFEQFKHLLTDKELVSAYTYLGLTWE